MRLAFQRRKDLLNLQAQLEVATQARKAVRAERLPTRCVRRILRRVGRRSAGSTTECFRRPER